MLVRFSKKQRDSEESNSGENMFRVIIAGSRSFANYEMLKANMNRLLQNISDEISIVCGTARGADRLGEKYAKENGFHVAYFPADWERYGKAAGYIRNREMAQNADALVAFWDGESRGRLDNKAARLVGQTQREQHILNSINNVRADFNERYSPYPDDAIRLYIDKSDKEDMESEIFMDVKLTRYPLRDYKSMWSEMHNVVKDYAKIGKRNQHAIEHNKLGKHMMHLIRLYMMCLDILENKEIVTFRSKEHDLLMSIRNGKYLDANRQPIPEFFEMVDEYEKKMQYAKENTDLPEKPDYKKIQEFVMDVNERVVRGLI